MSRPRTREQVRPAPERRTQESGLTLIEILVVVTMIALLLALASVLLGNKIHKARMARCHAELRNIQTTLARLRSGLKDLSEVLRDPGAKR